MSALAIIWKSATDEGRICSSRMRYPLVVPVLRPVATMSTIWELELVPVTWRLYS